MKMNKLNKTEMSATEVSDSNDRVQIKMKRALNSKIETRIAKLLKESKRITIATAAEEGGRRSRNAILCF